MNKLMQGALLSIGMTAGAFGLNTGEANAAPIAVEQPCDTPQGGVSVKYNSRDISVCGAGQGDYALNDANVAAREDFEGKAGEGALPDSITFMSEAAIAAYIADNRLEVPGWGVAQTLFEKSVPNGSLNEVTISSEDFAAGDENCRIQGDFLKNGSTVKIDFPEHIFGGYPSLTETFVPHDADIVNGTVMAVNCPVETPSTTTTVTTPEITTTTTPTTTAETTTTAPEKTVVTLPETGRETRKLAKGALGAIAASMGLIYLSAAIKKRNPVEVR